MQPVAAGTRQPRLLLVSLSIGRLRVFSGLHPKRHDRTQKQEPDTSQERQLPIVRPVDYVPEHQWGDDSSQGRSRIHQTACRTGKPRRDIHRDGPHRADREFGPKKPRLRQMAAQVTLCMNRTGIMESKEQPPPTCTTGSDIPKNASMCVPMKYDPTSKKKLSIAIRHDSALRALGE